MGPNPEIPTDLVTFNEEILNGNLHFLRSGGYFINKINIWQRVLYNQYMMDKTVSQGFSDDVRSVKIRITKLKICSKRKVGLHIN